VSKGIIFNIEEFAVHDGPGIRKMVFFKGCPLQCSWCHNPEGISFERELMVSRKSCIECGRCTEACKNDTCRLSGDCLDVCPLNLRKISGEEYDAEKLAAKLLKGVEVLKSSGGGYTISGGEPLAQPDFFFDIVEKLKPANIAVETSGYAPAKVFSEMVAAADLVLMDIKHTEAAVHEKFTGVSNELILRNLDYLCSAGTDFYVRIPLIPGINDSRENMEKTALLIKNAKHLIRIELLPYNRTAGAKYSMLYKEYKPGFDENRKVSIHRDVFEKYGIRVAVL
jgi:pyruvate formate lyase activating enzyme